MKRKLVKASEGAQEPTPLKSKSKSVEKKGKPRHTSIKKPRITPPSVVNGAKSKDAARKSGGVDDSKVLLGLGQDIPTGQGTSSNVAGLGKNSKKRGHKPKQPPIKNHEVISKLVLEDSKGNGFHQDIQSKSEDGRDGLSENKSSKFEKLKKKSLKGAKNGLNVKKLGTKTKVNKSKTSSSNSKQSHQPVGVGTGTNPGTLTKPDWVEFKKQKKELRLARKQKRSSYNVTVEAKQLWEVLRNQNNTPANSENLKTGVVKMHNLLKSHLNNLVMCHDTSRVVQWLIKMATPEIRAELVEELKPSIKKMIADRYASKCIGSLLKHGAKESAKVIIECCMGHVVKSMSNVISHALLEKAYAEYATDKQKAELHSEFYSDLYKSSKDSTVKCLADAYRDTPALKAAFLGSTKANLKRILNKNNATNRSTLLYAVMSDFLQECTNEDRDEILTIVRGWIFDLPSTKEAGHVGMLCVWHATNKEKKAIVKGLKGHIVEFAKSKHLQWILFAVFSLVDDTVLLSKVLFPEVVANLKELGGHATGRKLVVHLVSYANTKFFHPIEIKTLHEGEKTGTAKKDHDKKRQEILQLASKPFLDAVAKEPEFWFSCTCSSFTALAILTGAEDGDDKKTAFVAVAKLFVDSAATAREEAPPPGGPKGKRNKNEKIPSDDAAVETVDVPLVSHFAIHRLVQQLIKEKGLFTEVMAEELTDETMKYWIPHNRGCFILLHLLENGKESAVTKVTDLLRKHKLLLETNPSVGAQILLRKL